MKIKGQRHVFKWENLINYCLTKCFPPHLHTVRWSSTARWPYWQKYRKMHKLCFHSRSFTMKLHAVERKHINRSSLCANIHSTDASYYCKCAQLLHHDYCPRPYILYRNLLFILCQLPWWLLSAIIDVERWRLITWNGWVIVAYAFSWQVWITVWLHHFLWTCVHTYPHNTNIWSSNMGKNGMSVGSAVFLHFCASVTWMCVIFHHWWPFRVAAVSGVTQLYSLKPMGRIILH